MTKTLADLKVVFQNDYRRAMGNKIKFFIVIVSVHVYSAVASTCIKSLHVQYNRNVLTHNQQASESRVHFLMLMCM